MNLEMGMVVDVAAKYFLWWREPAGIGVGRGGSDGFFWMTWLGV